MAKSIKNILQDFSIGDFKPVYLLHGEEQYYLDKIGEYLLKNVVPEHEKGFNEVILYGKDISVGSMLGQARRFPMMADKQLVYVREAHLMQDLNNKEGQGLLESYAKNPLTSTVLVLHFGKSPDARKSWVKAMEKGGEIFSFKKLYDNQVPDFVSGYCTEKNIKISPKAIQLLQEHVGNNLEAITKEIDKIEINLKEGDGINAEVIEEYVGISKDFNVFELQKAITMHNEAKCFQIIQYFSANSKEHPIQPVINLLFTYFSKILLVHTSNAQDDRAIAALLKVNPFFVRDYTSAARKYSMAKVIQIIHALRIADQYSKGVNSGTKTESEIYKELIFNILN